MRATAREPWLATVVGKPAAPLTLRVCAAVLTAVINKRAGGMGLISGRKAFQRPMQDGIAILNAIQDVYLDSSVTVA